MLKPNNFKNKKTQEKVPHFPQNPHKALTDNKLEPFYSKNGTKLGQTIFEAENENFSANSSGIISYLPRIRNTLL